MSSCSGSFTSGMSRSRRWNDSGELDVFEAALYFSGEVTDVDLGLQRAWRTERRGSDTPTEATLFHQPRKVESRFKDKKHKQPCSPGGKLANLVSSFFHQAASKKKSKAVSPSQSFKEEYGERLLRRRRNSINHPEIMTGVVELLHHLPKWDNQNVTVKDTRKEKYMKASTTKINQPKYSSTGLC
nr:PREDICTED: protein BIG GRAIN 1-like E isoform X2 [Musa acuminata subsp. malaccensis]